jgi:hypothetical protein
MGDPLHERDAAADAVRLAASAALEYLDSLDSAPLRHPGAVAASETLGGGPLPEEGDGTLAALRELTGPGMQAVIQSAGPRMFHFVTGGVTPAALGADWLATLLDQNALMWVSSPLASRLEAVSVDWLKDLFRLPPDWEGVITSGATMANFTGRPARISGGPSGTESTWRSAALPACRRRRCSAAATYTRAPARR